MVILAASAASGVAALLEWLPDKVQIVANAVVAIAAVWGLFSDHARKAAVLHSVSLQCSRYMTTINPCGWMSRIT